MHPNGKFICAANRGDNSLAVLSIDDRTGRMVTFAVDANTGKLNQTGAVVEVPRPSAVHAATL